MITLLNMIFANPLAYLVFPNMVNTYNTGTMEKAVYTGHIVITDSSGNTYNFTNTSTIDFSNISGIVTIDNITDRGSVLLGRWNISTTTPEPEPGSDSKKASEAVAGDAVLYDETNDKLVIVDNTKLEDYTEGYTPIGVVVVPGTHNVYGDGSCGVMSLRGMGASSPDEGVASNWAMYWGGYGTDISQLPNLDQVCYVGSNGNVGESVIGTFYDARLPSDKFSTVNNPYDPGTGYNSNDVNGYIPSPYKSDGSFNTEYSRTSSPSSTANAMADFDGIGNSTVLWGLATRQSDWKTASSITNNRRAGYYPAACCCWRFHTEGTKQGDWYLPACGELGYIMPCHNKIQETITNLINAYGSSVGATLNTNRYYWSSTEIDSEYARHVQTTNGSVQYTNKGNYNYARAFLRVKDNNNSIDIVR